MRWQPRAAAWSAAALFFVLIQHSACLDGQASDFFYPSELLWPAFNQTNSCGLARWASLSDSVRGLVAGSLNYNPLYYCWRDGIADDRTRLAATSLGLLWKDRHDDLILGYAAEGGAISTTANVTTAPGQTGEFDFGSVHRNFSAYLARRSSPFRHSLWMQIGAGWGDLSGVGSTWWAGCGLLPFPNWSLTFEHRQDLVNAGLDVSYEGESIHLPLHFQLLGDMGAVRGSFFSCLHLSAEISSYAVSAPVQRSDSPGHEFFPRGGFQVQSYGLTYEINDDLAIRIRHAQNYLNTFAYFYEHDQSYGKMTQGDIFLSQVDIGITSKSWFAMDWEVLYRYWLLHGDLQGHFEFWPFTSTLIDLLGYRRYYHGEINLIVHSFHTKYSFKLGRSLRLVPGLSAYHAYPEGYLTSWQPLFLVFGKMDERTTSMTISEAWLGGLALQAEILFNKFSIRMTARQLFPIYLKRNKPSSAIPSESGLAPRAKTYGGGFLGIEFVYEIP